MPHRVKVHLPHSMPTFVPPGETGPVKAFDPLVLDKTVIALPLLDEMRKEHDALVGAGLLPKDSRPAPGLVPTLPEGFDTVIFLRTDYTGGAGAARGRVAALLEKAVQRPSVDATRQVLELSAGKATPYYLFARLDRPVRREMLALDEQAALATPPESRAIAFIWPTLYELIIDLNLEYPGGQPKMQPSESKYDAGRKGAREWVKDQISLAKEQIGAADDDEQRVNLRKSETSQQYLFARLEARVLQKLVALDAENAQMMAERESARLGRKVDSTQYRAIFRVWPDFEVSGLITKSIATVKADAAQRAFSASGAGITWAVMDSGIHGDHPHFVKHENIVAVNPTSGTAILPPTQRRMKSHSWTRMDTERMSRRPMARPSLDSDRTARFFAGVARGYGSIRCHAAPRAIPSDRLLPGPVPYGPDRQLDQPFA
jgi:serine protease AprX